MKEFILSSIKVCAEFMKKAAELAKQKTAASLRQATGIVKNVMGVLDSLTKSAAHLTGVDASIIKVTLAAMVVSAGVLYNSLQSSVEQPPVKKPPVEKPPEEQPPEEEPPETERKFLFSTDPYKQCISENMPNYLNNSMTWGGSSHMGALPGYKAISPPTIIVTVAGNYANDGRPFLDKNKVRGSKEFDAILVGSVSPYGHRSLFSQKGEEVTIMAPSNYEITSADKNGRLVRFSGTSGATPLVTGSLAAFSWLSGYQPTAKEAKLLLKKTAIPLRTSNANPQLNGPGMLNAYKLGMVGKRLKAQCGKDINCFKNMINQGSTYEFPEEEGLMEMVEQAFPECSTTQCREKSNSCEDKAAAFEKLRKAVFLNPSNDEGKWRYLSCIYSSSGFADNAKGARSIYDAILGAPPAENRFERDGKWLAGNGSCHSDADCKLALSCDNTVGDNIGKYYIAANKDYMTECQPLLCNGNCLCDGELNEPVNVRVFTLKNKDDYYAQKTKIIESSRAVCVDSQCVPEDMISSEPSSKGSGGSIQ